MTKCRNDKFIVEIFLIRVGKIRKRYKIIGKVEILLSLLSHSQQYFSHVGTNHRLKGPFPSQICLKRSKRYPVIRPNISVPPL